MHFRIHRFRSNGHRWWTLGGALLLTLMLAALLTASLSTAFAYDEENIPFYDPLDPSHPTNTDAQVSSIHFDLVKALAVAAGFSEKDASTIQLYSQLTDSSVLTTSNASYAFDAAPDSYPTAPDPATLTATAYCPSPETTPYSVTMGGTNLMECPGCFTSRFGPYGVFFHEAHDTPDELQSIYNWAFGNTSDLTAKVTFGYSSTVPFTWESPAYTITNIANVYEATACFYTQTGVTVDTGSTSAGSLAALGIYLHALGDHWSHLECIEAADTYTGTYGVPLPFAAHVTVKGQDDPLWACRWTSHEVEFGNPSHMDSIRTYTGTVEIYKAMLDYIDQGHGQPTYRPIPLDGENNYIDDFLHTFVTTGPNDSPGRRELAEEMRRWALFTRIDKVQYHQGILSSETTAGSVGVRVYTPNGATGTAVSYTVNASTAHDVPNGMQVIGNPFTITASDKRGNPITQFDKPISILANYQEDSLQSVDEASIQIYVWDTNQSEWQLLFSAADPSNNQAVGEIDHLSEFALMGQTGSSVAESRFTTGREGWRVDGDVQNGSGIPTHRFVGGHPAGYVEATDDVEGGTWYWVAPDKFLGDVSAAYGKYLSFDLKQESNMTDQYSRPDVVLRGTAIALIYNTNLNPQERWTSYSIQLHESAGWQVVNSTEPFTATTQTSISLSGREATQADFNAVLSDLRGLLIRGEYEDGADVGSLDNVVLGGDAPARTVDSEGGAVTLDLGVPVMLEFPAGAVTETITITGERAQGSARFQGHPAPDGRQQLGNAFRIEAHNGAGRRITQFAKPYTMTIPLRGHADLARFDIGSLRVYFWDDQQGSWFSLPMPDSLDVANPVLNPSLNHLTEFAIFGDPGNPLYLPAVQR